MAKSPPRGGAEVKNTARPNDPQRTNLAREASGAFDAPLILAPLLYLEEEALEVVGGGEGFVFGIEAEVGADAAL